MAEKNKRNLVPMFLLGFVTLGIYWLYWIYKVTELANGVTTLPKRSPVGQMLLCLIPFYNIYWYYQTSKRVDVMMESVGRPVDSGVLSLLLIFFPGLPIAGLVMQDKINTVLEIRTGSGVQKNISGALSLGIVVTFLAVVTGFFIGNYVDSLVSSEAFQDGFNHSYDYIMEKYGTEDEAQFQNETESVKKTEDGRWALVDGDEVETDFTGVAENENGLWYIEDGYVNFEFSGTVEDEDTSYKIENGKVIEQNALEN